jgi:hypothetical protein
MLSSAWESEQRKHNSINWNDPKNNWMKPDVRSQITQFQDTQIEQEFAQAVEEHRINEVYWVGGEPLMYEQHWRYMKRIVELGDGPHVYCRYNTNLSRVHYRGIDLFEDILQHVADWQICASVDGTGKTGEYIRTGLHWPTFLDNFKRGMEYQTHPRQMRLDFTLTLPGLFEVESMQQLADSLGAGLLAKVIFTFSPDIILSPLALPRELLNQWVDRLTPVTNGALRDVLLQLKSRPTIQEQWPDQWQAALAKGKRRILEIEKVRNDTFTLEDILKEDNDTYKWWKSIRCN